MNVPDDSTQVCVSSRGTIIYIEDKPLQVGIGPNRVDHVSLEREVDWRRADTESDTRAAHLYEGSENLIPVIIQLDLQGLRCG